MLLCDHTEKFVLEDAHRERTWTSTAMYVHTGTTLVMLQGQLAAAQVVAHANQHGCTNTPAARAKDGITTAGLASWPAKSSLHHTLCD